jgi:hypothetical protein
MGKRTMLWGEDFPGWGADIKLCTLTLSLISFSQSSVLLFADGGSERFCKDAPLGSMIAVVFRFLTLKRRINV